MMLFKRTLRDGGSLALIADVADDAVHEGMAMEALRGLEFVSRAGGARAFWMLLARCLEDEAVTAVAVSLNSRCVLDDELPERLEQACARAAGGAGWAVLAATGMCLDGSVCSVVYPSAAPRMFIANVPRPIVDCGLELFLLDASFLRAQAAGGMDVGMPPEYFPQWCILAGYLEGRLSVFRPELAIGVDGAERARDISGLAPVMQHAFGSRLPDEALPSLMGGIPMATEAEFASDEGNRNPRDRLLARPLVRLADLVRQAARPVTTPMSLSVVVRTRFTRDHLLRRMLASITRARQQADLALEIVLTTDVDDAQAIDEHRALQAEFPELEFHLQLNRGRYPHSRVDNLVGGILGARKDYVVVVDDDDFVDLDAFGTLSSARFLGQEPLLLMSSQVREEAWRQTSTDRWILESSVPARTYHAKNVRRMFLGSNQLPVCAMAAPRAWLQSRLEKLSLRHDLSEDYAIYLALLTAPDLPPLLVCEDVFCLISSRADGSNTITMKDRRPWVRDITLFLHDLFVADPVPGAGLLQLLGETPQIAFGQGARPVEPGSTGRQAREIAMLRAEIEYLRGLVAGMETPSHQAPATEAVRKRQA